MYKTLDTLLNNSYLQKLTIQQGGKCFGEGQYGKVCGVEELGKLKNNMIVRIYMLKPNSHEDIVYDEMHLTEFISQYNNLLVYKEIFGENAKHFVNLEIKNMIIVSNIDHNILYKDHTNHTYLYMQLEDNAYMPLPLYKRMAGDIHFLMEDENIASQPYSREVLNNAFLSVVSFLVNLHKKGYYHNDIKSANILYSVNQHGNYEFAVGDYGLIDKTAQLGSIKTPWRFTTVNQSTNFFQKYYYNPYGVYGVFDESQYIQMYNNWFRYNKISQNYQHLEDYFATHITFKSIFNQNHMYYDFDDVLLNPQKYFISDSLYISNPQTYLDSYIKIINPNEKHYQGGTRNTKIVLSKSKKEYKVREDKIGKYITQNRSKVYLSSIKGTYRYMK